MKLAQRTIFFVLLPIIFFSIIMIVFNHTVLSELLIEQEIEEVTLLAQLASYEMTNPMYNLDIDKLNEIIDGLELQEDVLQVLVLYPDGRVLTDGTDEDYNYGNILHDEFLNTPNIIDEKQIMITDNLIRFSIPIILNEPIGIIAIDYSLESVNYEIMNAAKITLLIGASLISLFVVVGIYFSRSITKPIFEIGKSVENISKGKHKPRQDKIGIPEIQKLNEGIDEMYEKLSFFQNELTKTERLATIGELSARIAHDLRNPLTTIQNSIDLIKIKNPDLVKNNTEYFDYIESSVNKINLEINGVLNHTKVKPLEKSTTSFLKIIKQSLSSLNIPENIKIKIPEKETEIFCDEKQLENVFSNLIGNSIEAIGGKQGEINISMDDKNDFYIIVVSDNGPGIPPEFVESIFEPLFTTKQYGTGLGLVNCKNIVHAHDGTIEVQNNPTRFTIKLPKK
ncbi:Sporulation kinase C protein [Marine Group I thaumarchaeote SCGC AAA799-E16]|uniref:histidine kinase n=2 Tax=Marine Group I TaxID=905826 RepID=A0A087RZQ3_9ARCH|nr:Sporulation kinase C protein [Marine Group I thaumarchaeote SCGC AAA799-E16]KFM18957.1 Sporulation kinase C protein [Marine Group I thaumarchaeote SCGC RSA3]